MNECFSQFETCLLETGFFIKPFFQKNMIKTLKPFHYLDILND